MTRAKSFFAAIFLLGACGTTEVVPDAALADDAGQDSGGSDAAVVREDSGVGSLTIGPAARPAHLIAPAGPLTGLAPLVVLLHGYGATGAIEDGYLGVSHAAATRGLYVLVPDGTLDASGKRFWEGTPGCCDFAHTGIDDVAYLQALVHEAIADRPIDPSRVYFFGHSNGGFMTYRIACQLASETAAVAILAASDFAGETDCVPSEPVSVLHLHGTGDTTIPYAGGNVGLGAFPGAVAVTQRWAARAHCDATPMTGTAIDMESTIAGAETTPTIYTGCDEGEGVQLLSIAGAEHIPTWQPNVIGEQVLDWLLTHHR